MWYTACFAYICWDVDRSVFSGSRPSGTSKQIKQAGGRMTVGGRLLDFGCVCLTAAAVWVAAQWLWPYLGLVAAVAALLALLVVVNLVDGIWFTVRHRRELIVKVPINQRQLAGREGTRSRSAA